MQRRSILQLAVAGATGVGLASPPAAALPAPRRKPAKILTRDGVGLHYQDWGAGKPVVFLHSWALASDMWAYQISPLVRAGRRCIAFDRRGHGQSDIPSGGYDYDTLADDLAAVLETLDLTDVTLVGHSMGGAEIVRYLGRHGAGRVEKTVLLAPTIPYMLKTRDHPFGLDRAAVDAIQAAWRRDFPQWLADNAGPFVTRETSPAMLRWLSDIMTRTPLETMIACNDTVVGTDFRTELPDIRTPTLILSGDKDFSAPLELTSRIAAEAMPNARLAVISGAPHGLFVTHMDQVNSQIAAFLAS